MKQRKFNPNKMFKNQVYSFVRLLKPDFVFISTQDKDAITSSGKYQLPNIGVPILAAKRNIKKGHFVLLKKSTQTWYSRDIGKKDRAERVLNIEREYFGFTPHAMIGERQTLREVHNGYHQKITMLSADKLPKGEVFFCESL